jgi:hypothetical protein
MFRFIKLDTPIFPRMSNLVINRWRGSLMFLLPFSMLQIYLDLQIFMFSSFLHPILKLQKSDTQVSHIGQSALSALRNLVINT